MKARERFLKDMTTDAPAISPLGMHLNYMRSLGDDGAQGAETLVADMLEVFTSDAGLRVLKLMEKSILLTGQPNGSSDSALREMNAMRNLVLDIRRIVAHG